jgi:hypothetical protein
VGGVATIGLFATEPIVRRLRPGERDVDHARGVLLAGFLASAHLACVAAASRWAGLARDPTVAALRVLAFTPLAFALTLWVAPVSAALAARESATPRHRPGHRQ